MGIRISECGMWNVAKISWEAGKLRSWEAGKLRSWEAEKLRRLEGEKIKQWIMDLVPIY
jgi:hypothetical protein